MSHYAVLVLHRADQDIEDLLAPYNENLDVAPYISFTRQEAIDYARKHIQGFADKPDEECWQFMADDAGKGMTDADGNILSKYNPRSKWDWWSMGGRYDGMMLHGEPVDEGRIGDLKFPVNKEAYEEALRFWDVAVDRKPARLDEDFQPFYREEYYREYYGDRETYARHQSEFSTYAVLTPDGEWHAPGDVGWFGTSSESGEEFRDWYAHYKERFLDSADPDWIATLIDCHI